MQQPIFINFKLQVNNNPIGLAPGSMLDCKIRILDEFEFIWTGNASFTKDLVRVEKLKPSHPGTIPKYEERRQTAIIKFPGLTQKEIAQIVSEDLKKLGVNQNG